MELSSSIGLGQTNGQLDAIQPPSVPFALGQLADLALEQNVAMTPAYVSTDFTGPQIVYSLAPGSDPLPAGLSLAPSGVISGTPTALETANVVIEGTNPYGSTTSGFTIMVLEMLLDFTTFLSGATINPTFGPSAETGVILTAGATDFSGPPSASVSYQWATVESGPIAGATSAAYAPSAALFDGETVFCTVTPVGYPPKTTEALVIRQVPPSAANALWDEILDLDSGPELYDTSVDFTGDGLVYSVTGPGTSINAATGLLAIDPSSPVAGGTVTVAAVNSGGSAQSSFTLTVEDAGVGPGPDIGQPILNDATNSIDFAVDVDCTIWWRRDATGTNPTADMVIGGGGFDSGSFAVSAGLNPVDIAFAPGNDGVQEISFVAAVDPTEPSFVQTVAIEIDATDPVLVASSPAAGAGSVDPAVSPTLTFSEPVGAGSGTVTLWDVTASLAHDVFDVVADAGTGAGHVEISGDTVTLRPATPLTTGNDYAILMDPGAVTDNAGNPFAGIASPSTVAFSAGTTLVIDTAFGTGFQAEEPALWSSVQANAYNNTPEHRGSETWDVYPASVSDGGLVGVKNGAYPQLRFSVPVEVGKTYTIDADFPVGEGTWAAPLRVKMGSAINLSDYAQIDESQAGQPRVVEVRGQQVTATTSELWVAVIVETGINALDGGHPAIAMLRVAEV